MRFFPALFTAINASIAIAQSPELALASSDETRALVEAMMADAATRSSLQSGGVEWPKEFRVWGFLQFRYTFNHREETEPPGEDNDTSGFSLNRVRLFFDANPFENVSARVRTTFSRSTGQATLDQAYVTITLPDAYKLRFGQFSLPLFRDENISAEKQLAVNASTVDELFNQGQAQGVMLMREWDDVRFWAAFSDGVRSSNRDFDSDQKADAAFTTRWEWKIAGDAWSRFDDYTSFRGSGFAAMLGGAIHYETGGRSNESRDDIEFIYVTTDLGLEGDGWNAFGAAVVVDSDDAAGDSFTDSGFIAQGGFFLTDRAEVFTRFDIIVADDDRVEQAGNFRTLTAGANYYFFPGSHALKLTGNLIWFLDEEASSLAPTSTNTGLLPSPADGQWALQFQIQAIF